jgi:hypothetical protein
MIYTFIIKMEQAGEILNEYIEEIVEAIDVMAICHPAIKDIDCLLNFAFRLGDEEHCMLCNIENTLLPALVQLNKKPVASFACNDEEEAVSFAMIIEDDYPDIKTFIRVNHYGMWILLIYKIAFTQELLEGLIYEEIEVWKIGAMYGYNSNLKDLIEIHKIQT